MILPRGLTSVNNPTSSETTGGQPATYTCNLSCGIGVGAGVIIGLIVLLGLWSWFWLRRPIRDSPEEREAEASRFQFLTGQHLGKINKEKNWARRASLAAKSATAPLTPALPRVHFRNTDRESPETRARLIQNQSPFDSVEQYRPSTAPLHGSFRSNDALVPAPLAVRSRASSPNLRTQHDVFGNCPTSRQQRIPWADGASFTNNPCYGKRVRQATNPNPTVPADASSTLMLSGGGDRGRNTIRKPIPPPTGKRMRRV
jgi:hypothetical protein